MCFFHDWKTYVDWSEHLSYPRCFYRKCSKCGKWQFSRACLCWKDCDEPPMALRPTLDWNKYRIECTRRPWEHY